MPDDDDKITYLVPVPTHAPEAEVLDVEAPDTEAPEEDNAARLASVTSSLAQREARLAEAQQAWARINTTAHQLWEDWVTVGEALAGGRATAIYASGAKGPSGKKYSAAFSDWLESYGFDDIDETTRAHLLKVMDEYDAVKAWRSDILSDDQRQKWNHPSTVLQHFNAWKQGKRPPVKSSLKASLENTIRERDDAKVEIARLKRQLEEDQGPQMTKRDEPADQALCTYHWMPTLSAFGDYIRECQKLYKNPPRPSPLPKPPAEIPPRRYRPVLEPEEETEEE